jgi:RNA polymerase sigma-70 factor (ECF subfamily)
VITFMAQMTRLDALGVKQRRRLRSLSDSELVEQFQRNRDVDVFEVLVRRHQDKVYSLASSILGRRSGSEAEDATQEAFIAAYRQLHKFRGEAAFSTWLYSVARNQVAGFRRRTAHRVVSGSEDELLALQDTDAKADPLSTVTDDDTCQQLLHVVDKLPESQKTIVHLFYWRDQSINDISALLNMEANTIKSHLRRARINLAEILRETDIGD